ncbi:sulfite exporter TauE/SafE family protein [Usitatibacter palustris]|uniref:Urease accessory protein UreH-like transmembrane domain-containing protein n=1 Tax=Usitatibacter palustris TaxID=2732487 RepID=A0A6M4H4P3_9PROT|nr:sulfite exporter TauE/SafE family protein [Usitatibacter palustris]QJR14242.1 hypothetical protein DSM104440_01035 [Usitatibacter palustris]
MSSFALGALALGFLGSAHCAAMCGGFARAGQGSALALHAGRIGSYMLAGAAVGAVGAAPAAWITHPSLQLAAFGLACLVLFVTGVRIAGIAPVPSRVRATPAFETLAASIARRVGPPGTASRRFALGVLWGWAPCALVYAALPLALVSGSAASGAISMAAFGLGTVPALLGAGWVLARLGERSRKWAGVLLMLLAVTALFGHAASHPLFCVTPTP